MGCELRVFEPSNKIKACLMTAKGMIGVVLQVYLSGGSDPSMVEVRVLVQCRCPMFLTARSTIAPTFPRIRTVVRHEACYFAESLMMSPLPDSCREIGRKYMISSRGMIRVISPSFNAV